MQLKLILLFFRKNFFRSFFITFLFFIIIFSSILAIFIQKNTTNFFVNNTFSIKDEKKFIIIPSEKNSFFNKQNKDLQKVYENLLKDKNIKNLKAYFFPKIPTTIILNLLGKNLETDVFLYFIEEKNQDKNFEQKDYIPLIISQKFLNLYNLELAGNSFFPKLNKDNISNLELDFCLNKSSFFSLGNNICKKAKIEKTSMQAPLIGVVVEKNILKNLLKKLSKKELLKKINNAKIIKIVGEVNDKKYIKKMQLKNVFSKVKILSYDEQKSSFNKKMNFLNIIIYSISFVIIFISLLFLIYIIFSYFEMEKRIFDILYFDGIGKTKIFFLGYSYFLLIFFIAIIINFIILKTFDFFVIPVFNNYVLEKIGIEFLFENISIGGFFILDFIILLIFSFIYFIIFRKKFRKYL